MPGRKEGEPVKLSTTIVGLGRRIVKAVEAWLWLQLERLALWILARSYAHVTPGVRLRRVVSAAYLKGNVVPIVPQAQRCGWLN